MIDTFLARVFINQWMVFALSSAILLALSEAGCRRGLAFRRRNPEAAQGHSGSVQGAILGLLGLLLGFSFAMAVGRHEARRALVADEAGALGTAWLNTDFLPPEQRDAARSSLRRYAEIKLARFDATTDSAALSLGQDELAGLQKNLWAAARNAVEAKPDAARGSLVTAVTDLIDLDGRRRAALRNHVPGPVWILLLVVAGCGAWSSGYGSGATGLRSSFNQAVFPILIATVVTLIADIDRPLRGLIGLTRVPLQEAIAGMR